MENVSKTIEKIVITKKVEDTISQVGKAIAASASATLLLASGAPGCKHGECCGGYKYNWSGEHVTQQFKDKVADISSDLKIDKDDLMAVMAFESGFSPSIKNKYTNATGLIQFMPETAEMFGTNIDDLAKMNAVDQLDYVSQYFEPYSGKMNNLGDVYMAVFWPAAIGENDSYILCSQGSTSYEYNEGLDIDENGHITRGEAVKLVINRRDEYNWE